MLNTSNSEGLTVIETTRREELVRVIEIIAARTKSGGTGIAEEVHQAIQRTRLDFHELVRFGLLGRMIDIFQDALDNRQWTKAMRIMESITPKEDFMNSPTVRFSLEAAYVIAISTTNRAAVTHIRKMAPWISISRPEIAPTKPYVHFQPKSTVFAQTNQSSVQAILDRDPNYRHGVPESDPAVQVLNEWEKRYVEDPERLKKIMNLCIIISKGRRALKIDSINGKEAGFTVALDFHESPENLRNGVRIEPNGHSLFTLQAAKKYTRGLGGKPGTLEKHGSLLMDWEFQEVLADSMPEYWPDDFKQHLLELELDGDPILQPLKIERFWLPDFKALFNPTKVHFWDHELKEFLAGSESFWTDLEDDDYGIAILA